MQFARGTDQAQKTASPVKKSCFFQRHACEEFLLAKKLKAIINLDDISHIAYLEKYQGCLPSLVFATTREN
jgi:hypothetical protein